MTPDVGTRRANREGNYRFRAAENRWEGRVMIAGLGRFSVFGRTRDEARRKLEARLSDLEAGLRPPSALLTTGEWLDEWLAGTANLAARTRQSYADTVRLYIRPAIGKVPLSRLSPGHVARMLADQKVGPTTVRYIYAVLRIALGRAVKAGRVSRNVCELIDPPRRSDTQIVLLTTDQTHALIDALAHSPQECLIVTALATGLREGELCGLWWSDIDLEAATVTVRAQLQRGGTKRVEPKRGSRRTLGLPLLAVSSLRSHRAKAIERAMAARRPFDEDSWVFLNADGKPLQGWSAYGALQRVLRNAKLPKVRFHSLRHAFASTLLGDGEDLANVSKLLGHRSIGTTSDQYGHLTSQASRRGADRMERALRRAT